MINASTWFQDVVEDKLTCKPNTRQQSGGLNLFPPLVRFSFGRCADSGLGPGSDCFGPGMGREGVSIDLLAPVRVSPVGTTP